ncbi:hypothetical protein K450DRAFT_242566 [Umbelopsis ramanniana AG]|uniref:Uncharacterized protein n=1 Tax=Umbelopsis ramanniana AG TaxID=1314678 RepID=A0AAD5HCP8_UMBRA|nr:uncharacterized protein K450DRAFT_242566 [Umbelopsis ramanniana AG]KAI8579302.1 hypothetical protein K450DRAFT_242566 [Umbelopsis ramanniana AG]
MVIHYHTSHTSPCKNFKTEGFHHIVFLRPLIGLLVATVQIGKYPLPSFCSLLLFVFFKLHSFINVSTFPLLFFSFIRCCLLFLYSMYLHPYHTTLRYKNRLKRWQAFGDLHGKQAVSTKGRMTSPF